MQDANASLQQFVNLVKTSRRLWFYNEALPQRFFPVANLLRKQQPRLVKLTLKKGKDKIVPLHIRYLACALILPPLPAERTSVY